MNYITFALGKGRLANKTLALLEEIGITCEEMKDKDTRKLAIAALFIFLGLPGFPQGVPQAAAPAASVSAHTAQAQADQLRLP